MDAEGRRVIAAGECELLVGPFSRDEALLGARFTVDRGSSERPAERVAEAALTP
ncbi:MAG: hypothetical protein WBX17_01415 [Microbacterium sp.]